MAPRTADALQRARTRAVATGAALTALMAVALFLPPFDFFVVPQTYAAVHLLIELLAIVVSLLVFAVGWNAFPGSRSGDQIVLACGLLAVALIDLMHALSYQGMPDLVSPSSPEKAIAFWLVARTLMALTLLAVALRWPAAVSRRVALALALAVSAVTAWVGFLHLEWLPRTFIAGQGLTGFKVAYEWALVAGFGLAALLFVRRTSGEQRAEYWWLSCASFAMALGEVFFSRYVAVSDLFNFLGHVYKVVAFAIIYQVVFVTGMHLPYLVARAVERKFRASFDQAFQYMGLLSPDGRLIDVNRTAVQSSGIPPEQLLGKLVFWRAPWWQDDHRARIEDAVRRAARGETVRVEVTHAGGQGELRHADLSLKPVFDDDGAVELLIAEGRDITAVKQQAEALRELNATLEQRVAERTGELQRALQTLGRAQDELVRTEKLAALGSLVAGVAHELNTPLGNALIVASTLRDKSAEFERAAAAKALRRSQLDDYVATNVEAADLIMNNLRQAADLVASFKQVAVDQTSTKRRDFDLRETIDEMLSTLRVRVKNRPITVRTELADGIRMNSYPGPLGQVITNLFNNALEHAFAGRATGEIVLRTHPEGDDRVVMEFADDGAGIAAADLPKIFDPFFTTRLGQGGSGLGLNIVHNIVTGVLGGRIAVESTPEKGTCFSLTLPLVAPRAAETPNR